tara:strand:+ start:1367 stop:7483 length:6117 start_codon:yes stop_codon:yes gene_type:complete
MTEYYLDDQATNATGYRSKKRNIPFYAPDPPANHKVKLVFDKFDDGADFEASLPRIRRKAMNRFILHYFPEYYVQYRVDIRDKASQGSNPNHDGFYHRFRQNMEDTVFGEQITAQYYTPHNPTIRASKNIVIASLRAFSLELIKPEVEILKETVTPDYDIYNKVRSLNTPGDDETESFTTRSPVEFREMLEILDALPSIVTAMALFNKDEEIAPMSQRTTLVIGSLLNSNNLVNDGMKAFQQQMDGWEGSLPVNLDFNSANAGMMAVLNGVIIENLVKEITNVYRPGQMTATSRFSDFTDADILQISFGKRGRKKKLAIAGITYLVNEISIEQQVLKTGYMTNILYNVELNDPFVLSTLKNYEQLLSLLSVFDRVDDINISFLDFLQSTPPGEFGLDSNFAFDDLPAPGAPTDNIFLREAAKAGIIDLGNVKSLEKGFKLALTPEEIQAYKKQVRENPEVYKKAMEANKAKALKTGKDIAKGLDDILNGNFPGVKANSKLGIVLRTIGIDELAKEAMICLTFGLAPAFSRLTQAVAGAISTVGSQVGQELYTKPRLPKPSVTIPPIEIPKIFTIDGNLWPQIQKILVDTLMQGVLEIVKSLAQLLSELCKLNNPRAEDYGDTDLSDLVTDNLLPSLPNISNQSALDQMLGNDGLTLEQMMKYLRDLSAVLSSMEICFLFTSRNEVTYDTVIKILDFNLSYSDLQIRETLNTYGALMGFFANLSRFVDITEFCNQVATEIYQANIDNICLLEDAAPDNITEKLLDIAENGLQLDMPSVNLECPLRDDFISNPLVSNTLPELFNTIAYVVEDEFVTSVASALQILKEPDISANAQTKLMAETLAAANATGEELEGLSQVGQDILGKMQEVFAEMGSLIDELEENCDIGEILGVEADQVATIIEVIIDVMNELLSNGEFAAAIEGIEQKIAEISGSLDGPGGLGSIAATYVFPADFTAKFQKYMPPKPSYTLDAADPLTKTVTAGQFYSMSPGANSAAGYSEYKPLQMTFTFPTKLAKTWVPDTRSTARSYALTDSYSIVSSMLAAPNATEVDALTIKFPSYSTAVSDNRSFVDVTLKSKLMPTGSDAINFNLMNSPIAASDARDANPYVGLFVDNLLDNITFLHAEDKLENNPTLNARATKESDSILFPMAYAGLVESTFEYIQTNGVFDEVRLDSLNFFNNNANCIPENVADLLDIAGILKLMNDEILDALCYDEDGDVNPMGSKIRDVIRYGVFLLLIQLHIAQFIIKNIFVFAAYEIDDFFTVPVVKEFMSITIRQQIETLVQSQPVMSEKMVEYFNKKIKRKTSLDIGGLANSSNEIVFPEGKIFDGTDFPAIVEYMTGKRIFNSRLPVSNAVKKSSELTNPKSFNRSFVEDILTVQPSFFGATDGSSTDNEQPGGMAYRKGIPQNTGAPQSFGRYMTMPRSSALRIAGRDRARAYFSPDTTEGRSRRKNLEYGKLVLERQVVWTSVTSTDDAPVPDIFKHTTGNEYGLELDLFRMVLFDPTVRSYAAGSTEELSLKFFNLAIKHQIVYYLPALNGEEEDLFYRNSSDPSVAAMQSWHQCNLGDGLLLRRVVVDRLDSNLGLGSSDGISTADTALRYVLGTIEDENGGLARQGYVQAEIPILKTQLQVYNETVSNSELELIVADPVFQNYFDKAFNRTLITMVPIIHNFYLTTSYFPKMQKLLRGPKQRCIQIFVDSVFHENSNFSPPAALGPQAQAANRKNKDDPFAGLQQSAIDFILKMLIETPINILKGLSELLDPHVALSKIIRDVTGFAFAQAAKVIDAAPPIEALRSPVPMPTEEDPENTGAPIAPAISGEGVMKLLFCVLQIAMKAAQQGYVLSVDPLTGEEMLLPPVSPDSANFLGEGLLGDAGAMLIGNPPAAFGSLPGLPEIKMPFPAYTPPIPAFAADEGTPNLDPDNIFYRAPREATEAIPGGDAGPMTVIRPAWDGLKHKAGDLDPRDPRNNMPPGMDLGPKITIKGVDFTGTFLGLLMLPPGPFGIVYLLLMLLKNELEDALTPDERAGQQNVSEGENSSEC